MRGEPAAVEPLTDGDRIAAGDAELSVVHLPGHAAGLAALAVTGVDAAPPDSAEAFAHLDHLEHEGVVERDGSDYRLVDLDRDVPALFPNTKY